MSFILTLAVLLLYFIRRYLLYRNYVKQLAKSLERRQGYLFDDESTPQTSKYMSRLRERINSAIQENIQLQQSRQSHLEQPEANLVNNADSLEKN
ncbi:MAG: hypothetical protein CMI18_06160 [Opitutaceae bacterium]|nr:hypothetical protein [Opitutaceae bacterium]|tara:strand:+ start:6307 stop:6591 length:285 start_codon:yes stop_codon:yes gene_type:complete